MEKIRKALLRIWLGIALWGTRRKLRKLMEEQWADETVEYFQSIERDWEKD